MKRERDETPVVVRIVVNGSPSKAQGDNSAEARKMLLQTFRSDCWPAATATFATTPGGFIQAPFPRKYDGGWGWNSSPKDFKKIIPSAQKAIHKVVTKEVLKIARRRAEFLTVGVDLNNDGGKLQTVGAQPDIHAEVVGVVNTASGEIVHWTGKSYPVERQKSTLVHEANLQSHLFRCGGERVLVLGCHDLNMFSERSYANQDPNGLRRKRSDEMRRLATAFKPTVILQHAHATDSPNIWSTGWSGARELLRNGCTYASGIAYYRAGKEPRRRLDEVRARTRCCGSHVVDVVVDGYRRRG